MLFFCIVGTCGFAFDFNLSFFVLMKSNANHAQPEDNNIFFFLFDVVESSDTDRRDQKYSADFFSKYPKIFTKFAQSN